MNVNFDGRTYSFEVSPGEGGYKMFTEAIRNAFNLPEDSELNITFTCDEPSTGVAGCCCSLFGLLQGIPLSRFACPKFLCVALQFRHVHSAA